MLWRTLPSATRAAWQSLPNRSCPWELRGVSSRSRHVPRLLTELNFTKRGPAAPLPHRTPSRYTEPRTSGHRQVVRHQLPKLTLAGSSPVARSNKTSKHGRTASTVLFSSKRRDSNPRGCERKENALSVFSERARTPTGDRSRSGFAQRIRGRPVARSNKNQQAW